VELLGDHPAQVIYARHVKPKGLARRRQVEVGTALQNVAVNADRDRRPTDVAHLEAGGKARRRLGEHCMTFARRDFRRWGDRTASNNGSGSPSNTEATNAVAIFVEHGFGARMIGELGATDQSRERIGAPISPFAESAPSIRFRERRRDLDPKESRGAVSIFMLALSDRTESFDRSEFAPTQ
jgi:hypothetical protein